MKVVHVTSIDSGGAGLAVLRIHQALHDKGIDSSVLVLTKTGNDKKVIPCWGYLFSKSFINQYEKLLKLIWRQFNPIVKKLRHSGMNCFFTLPISIYRVENHPQVKNADIIHLHWVQNFINYPSFFSKINKPCVWTFHDENISFGGFHCFFDRDNLYSKYQYFEDYALQVKREALTSQGNLLLVPLSKMMKEHIDKIDYCNHLKKKIIHNPVNCSIYSLHNKIVTRQQLGIPLDKKIILFVAYNIFDRNKGIDNLIAAIKLLNRVDVELCCVGGNCTMDIDIPHIYMGYINDEKKLSEIYSAADLFVLASEQEAFSQTPLESIASGTPVVVTPCSGTEELVNEHNGIRCNDFTIEELARCIDIALGTSYDSNVMREDIINRFSPEHIARQYIEIYRDMLKTISLS